MLSSGRRWEQDLAGLGRASARAPVLTLQQQHVGDAAAFVARHPRMLRSLTLNSTIHDSALLLADELSGEEITARIRAMIGSRSHNVGVTPLERSPTSWCTARTASLSTG